MINFINRKNMKAGIWSIVSIKIFIAVVLTVVILFKRSRARAIHGALKGNIDQAQAKGAVWMGVEVLPLDKTASVNFGIRHRRGLLVRKVFRGSPADKAGLKKGDVILRLGTRRVRDMRQFKDILKSLSPGQKIGIAATSGGKRKAARIVMESRPLLLPDTALQFSAYQPYAPPPVQYRQYQPPPTQPYPYFTFGGEEEYENERE